MAPKPHADSRLDDVSGMKCPQNRVSKIFLTGLAVMATLASISLVAPKPSVARTESPGNRLEASPGYSGRESGLMTPKDQHHKILPMPRLQTRQQALDASGQQLINQTKAGKTTSSADGPMIFLGSKTPSHDDSR